MSIKPIKNEKEYQDALKRIEVIFDSKKGTPEGDELEILRTLIEKYEDEDLSDCISAEEFRKLLMEAVEKEYKKKGKL